jgi:predicted ATP-binding protein involved in virulence
LFHLNDFDIPISREKFPHLIITGKNGSGKTVLLNAISDFLNIIKNDKSADFLGYQKQLDIWKSQLRNATDERGRMQAQQQIERISNRIQNLYGKIDLQSDLLGSIIEKYNRGEFVIAFYQADRKVKMSEPKNPTKPV